jgi:class 3 adenylate cyclase
MTSENTPEPEAPPLPPTPAASQPGGELRFVTVIFADLAGFTAFAEERAPDEVAKIVGDLLQRLGQVVEHYGGGVDKFLGDAVVATFGLPRPDPNAARNAVRAGLAMQTAAQRFNQENGLNFDLRVGIHAGEVMFRAIGGSWTVMGDTVNTASRIQNATTPGKVWISRPVYEEVRRFFVLLARPAVELKGKKHSVQPYEVLEERRTPFVNLPPFVGREKEWAQIMQEINQAQVDRNLRVVLLRGAAGIGKSRLAWELRDWIQRTPQIYRVNMVQFDAGDRLPSHGLNTIIRSRFDLPLELENQALLEQLQQRMPQENPAAGQRAELVKEFFAFILGITADDFRTANMDGKSRWESAFIELKAWQEAVCQEEPGVWFLEDAQKGDADTAAFIEWALRVDWHVPFLILITVREEDFGPECYWYPAITRWVNRGQVKEIRLKDISCEALAQAIFTMLEGELTPDMARRIAEHTEGNPLFAIELALLLKDTGQLNLPLGPNALTLPGSVREVMEARIERLGQDGKEVAKRGSLIGRRFTREAVERTWDRPNNELNNGYLILHETETVYEEESKLFTGKQEDVFRHGRLQEAVLARIPREERLKWLKELENWALSKLAEEENWAAAGALLVPLIARSREEQRDAWQASLWYEVLGLLHLKSYRSNEASHAFRAALPGALGVRKLVLAAQLAQTEVFSGEGEKALMTIDSALNDPAPIQNAPSGQPSEVIQALLNQLAGDALARWQTLSLAEAAAALRLERGKVLTNLGRVEEARQVFQNLGAELEPLHSQAGQRLLLRWGRAWAYLLSELIGRHQEAHAVCQALNQHASLRDPALEDEWQTYLSTEGLVAERLGRYAQAQEIADKRMQVALAQKDLRSQTQIWNTKGIVTHLLGDLDGAADCYQRARDISQLVGDRRGEVIGLFNLAGIYIDQLKLDQAAQFLEQYQALSRITGNRLAEAYGPLSFSNLELERGHYEQAEHYIRQAIQAAEQNGWPALVEMCQASQAMIDLYRWFEGGPQLHLEQACHLLRASMEADPDEIEGESRAVLALALFFSGKMIEARAMLDRPHQRQEEASVSDQLWLELVEKVFTHTPLDGVRQQFHNLGFLRAEAFIQKIQKRVA